MHKLEKMLDEIGVTAACTKTAARPGWGHAASHWKCTMHLEGRQLTTPFSMGSAHMGKPKVADMVASLLMDASCGKESFKDYCSNFGCSTDSLSAQNTWKACRAAGPKIRQFLGKHYTAAKKAAEDY